MSRVDDLLDQMTVAEKLAQLGSFWVQDLHRDGATVAPLSDERAANPAGFDDAVAHGLGQLTRTWGTSPLTVAEGLAAMRERQRVVVESSRFGVPAIAHEECLTGFTAYGATVYPTALAWGATFDPDLVEQMAAAIGDDMASVGVHQALSPVLDVVHDYRWGRVEETIGEDPHLVATIGTAYVKGLEGAGIIATLKHFAGYSASVAALNHGPVRMGRRHLLQVVLEPFEMAVRLGGARSVMNSYTDVDGVPCAADPWLLTEVLRDQWGFEGTVVSDYFAINFLREFHHVAETKADAAVLALQAGLDVELPHTDTLTELGEAIESGRVQADVLDVAVRRVLQHKHDLGLLEPGWQPRLDDETSIDLDSARNRDIARRLADESIVLLANDETLPLAPGVRLAAVGPVIDDPLTMLGCYSFPNHVLKHHPGGPAGIEIGSILDALRAEFGEVTHARGCEIEDDDLSGVDEAVAVAREADVVVVGVGDIAGLFGAGSSGEGNDVADLRLPGGQQVLVERLLDTGVPVVLLVVSGRPYALGDLAPRCAAVVQAFCPGEEGAQAIAGVRSGRVNPSGRLPVGVPRVPGAQPWTYLAPPLGRRQGGLTSLDPEMLYPFGHGLSYTTFALSDLQTSSEVIDPDGQLEVSVTVANTGDRDGTHVVQLYLRDEVAQVTTPVKRLIGYARVDLAAGQARRVTFSVHADRTSLVARDLRRVVEPGWLTLWAGSSSMDEALSARFRIEGDLRVVEGERVMVTPVSVEEA
ncbi:glycoside hydrolase family 3 N-terminal domain-containing protein [Aestuariimicrobium ganziense]|uniref:glycoside hydrolase family 3 N-terminal domain-containing protein n=1 Tax=Aestuariimicrobium ganziense TaxID=2773677 RepID=UPI001942A155|nr:glycoside hydrolase family 3 N-terminal domain-containing protein [Aestuariimicrobium ganziense]